MNTCMHCGFIGNPEEFTNPSGRVCEECHKKYQKKYRRDNKEKVAEQQKEYRRENKEKITKGKKKYQKDNKEKIAEQRKKYYQNNREEIVVQSRNYRENNKEKIAERNRKYRENNKDKIAKQKREFLQANHEEINEKRRRLRRKNGILPWTEIKHLRLGLYVEQAIAEMFGSVQEVTNNPGVDFICPNGYKMQVKAASMRYNHGKHPAWSFGIRKNKVVDYFVLVAVNNTEDIDKEDFKPAHIWLMKGNLVNKRGDISIALSRISKWNKYSIMDKYENKFINCCDTIKENKPKDTTK